MTPVRTLFHWPFDPASRTLRLALGEKGVAAQLSEAPHGEHHSGLQALLPGAAGPALVDRSGAEPVIACGTHAALEFLEESDTRVRLLPADAPGRAEVRRLWHWVESEFDLHVTPTLLAERLTQALHRAHTPRPEALRQGAHALRGRLTYLNALAEARPFLAGASLTLADLIAAAHLSCLDYFGDVDWARAPDLRDWYARLKSRPCFRPLLADRLGTMRPAPHYADLDF
jgi:glutathione S-transferase